MTNKGYVNAEDVIGVRNPQYDEDNLNFETAELFGLMPLPVSLFFGSSNLHRYEDASRAMIQKGLDRIQ